MKTVDQEQKLKEALSFIKHALSLKASDSILKSEFPNAELQNHQELLEEIHRLYKFLKTGRADRDAYEDSIVEAGQNTEQVVVSSSAVAKISKTRPTDGAFDFLVLEAIHVSNCLKKTMSTYEHLSVLKAYFPDLNKSSIPPKLGIWRKKCFFSYPPRKPMLIRLEEEGYRARAELYYEAQNEKECIELALKSSIYPEYKFAKAEDVAAHRKVLTT